MKEAQVSFNNWVLALDMKFLAFQVASVPVNADEYWMNRNCVLYDYEIHRIRKYNNSCKACNLPLYPTKNFEVYLVGPVCQTCWTLYSTISANKYFYDLHQEAQKQKYRGLKG